MVATPYDMSRHVARVDTAYQHACRTCEYGMTTWRIHICDTSYSQSFELPRHRSHFLLNDQIIGVILFSMRICDTFYSHVQHALTCTHKWYSFEWRIHRSHSLLNDTSLICDTPYSHVQHASGTCATYLMHTRERVGLIHMCNMPHSDMRHVAFIRLWLGRSKENDFYDLVICMTWSFKREWRLWLGHSKENDFYDLVIQKTMTCRTWSFKREWLLWLGHSKESDL